jgi:UDP-galactopyranose mutase
LVLVFPYSAKKMQVDVLVIGAGFAGSVCAQQLAEAGYSVVLVDRRAHVGGNAHDRLDSHGVLIHPYGPHIFHTNSRRIFDYLSRFTTWRFYEHRVLARVKGMELPIPINRTTLNRLYGLQLDEAGAADFLARVREPCVNVRTSEDVVLASIGRELTDLFYRGYTRKQWGLDLSDLSAGVAARIPVRTTEDDRYFSDEFQFMPENGYTAMFQSMLTSPRIRIRLGVDGLTLAESVRPRHTVYTGPIDAWFEFQHGQLPYRSLRFEHIHLPETKTFQRVGTINFPNDHAYTRITEFKHLTGQQASGTSLVREYPTSEGDPFYPIPRAENDRLYGAYRALAEEVTDVTFVGRLAQYRYYNMDQVVGAALEASHKLVSRLDMIRL